ncbi:MAG: methionine adenosyltransferase [Candidatus Brocadia sp. AMX2]|uniref:S-adenosylmethionine synthase n=1 Tax=Candidatus Brocadia sinica JPN1 TaxID=1197129 RepID=A0ABQ0K064_9BACT|nr:MULTISPECIES: methionine adenosyltransferase [Brocadia]MBC6932138.1 methionine adenosyltransferase [Candidatus Brocadia sp.]MBL1169407.1 methionine adenosyltransferase [Candidatus Brocadia sp. AMX1]NOG42281.1 methionine adenosyltransferase [Planctomycetota bacterium]GIK11492.1 MAG: S-adenosylmethionine synthase [Candidatus Brocadia sinica]KAA0244987.1 MAG: methionine adenosyltransferase [Candidatus Brocadia sp. AMX2]
MKKGRHVFTSESVSMGHPDKVADQISDAVLDAMLEQDPMSRVACETLVTTGVAFVAGEFTTKANANIPDIVRNTIKEIGYNDASMGFDYNTCAVLTSIGKQSPDISQGVSGEGLYKEHGAGDQGMMFGYACNDTPELMPLPIMLAHRIIIKLAELRQNGTLKYLRPDAKSQVTIEYQDHTPVRVHTVVISTQHAPDVKYETIKDDMIEKIAKQVIPVNLMDGKTIYHINPTGRFVIGGPQGDCGLTGRKIIVDTYGGWGRHGGGAFSGKDPTKVDRSACYAARHIAKNVVASGLAERCEAQVAYAIGVAKPLAIHIATEGTGKIPDEKLTQICEKVFDMTPKGIIDRLKLRRPIYKITARHGHFGRPEDTFTWEKTDMVDALRNAADI